MKDNIILAAETVAKDCMQVKENENLLIITDEGKRELANDVADAIRNMGIEAVVVEGVKPVDNKMPELCAAALEKADVALFITSGSFSHTKERAAANERGCRIASMPTITEEIMETTLTANFNEVERIGNILADKLSKCESIHITTELGTDLTLYCDGRNGIADTGKLGEKGAFGNLPAGEAMVAPIETKGTGLLVVDGVIVGMGSLIEPLTIEFKDGRIENVSGKQSEEFLEFINKFDDNAKNVCEFGIGTNEKCHLMGNPLVDEKIYGTIHIACGNNLFMGGEQDSNMHYDMIVTKPTVYLDDECIIKDGVHIY